MTIAAKKELKALSAFSQFTIFVEVWKLELFAKALAAFENDLSALHG